MQPLSERIALQVFKFWGLMCVKNIPTGQKFLYQPFIFGIILISLTCSVNIYGLVLEMKSPNSKWMPTTTAIAVTFIHYGTLMLSTVIIIVMAAWNYDEIGKVYHLINVIEEKLAVHKKYFKMQIVLITSLTFGVMFYFWEYLVCIKINKLYSWYTPVYVYQLLFIIFILQLAIIAVRIKQLFHALNQKVSNTLKPASDLNIAKNLPSVETLSVSLPMRKSLIKDKSLPELCDLHWDICEAINCFNNAFGTQIMFHFLTIFIHLIDSPYFVFLATKETISSDESMDYLITSLIWIVVYAAQLFAIVLPCAAATKIGSETSFILCKHLHFGLPIKTKKEVKSFLQLLEVHSTDFNCGLFTLNESVISAVTGSVTTYLVILIQFQNQDFGT